MKDRFHFVQRVQVEFLDMTFVLPYHKYKGDVSMRDKIIRINWSEPMQIDEAIELEDSLQSGLYYITRILHGKETSLYIGKATRTIRERLICHRKEWLSNRYGEKNVRLGRIIYPYNVDSEIIDHAESAIIFEHGDILIDNTDKIKTYSYSELYQIQNVGNLGELKETVCMHNHPD